MRPTAPIRTRSLNLSAAGWLGLSAMLLSGCVVGPGYSAPAIGVCEAWIASVETSPVDGLWWRKLNNPV